MTSLPAPIVVVEVGGSSMRGGRFQPDRLAVTGTRRRRSPGLATAGGEAEVLHVLRGLVDEVAAGAAPGAVAVAYPGPISPDGTVIAAPTLLGGASRPLALRSVLADWWPGAAVHVLNDLTAAGYRVVAEGGRDFCILTVGSGIGHKVFVQGAPVVGPGGRGGELGHWQVDDRVDAPPCDCGGRGHLGGIASGRGALALVRRALEADPVAGGAALGIADAQDLDNAVVVSAYRSGDPWVRQALAPAITELGRALAGVHTIVGTERFVLVGGFARAMGDVYRSAVAASAAAHCWALDEDWDEMVELGADDDDHGMIGAGLLAAGLVAT